LAALSHLFSKSVEWKWINHHPAKINRLKEDSGRIIYLTTPQVSKLLRAASEHQAPFIYPFIKIALATSMRKFEILSVRIENIDLQRRVIYIPHAKAGTHEQPIKKSG